MTQLAPCPACARHVRVTETHCPFCESALAPATAPAVAPISPARTSRAVLMAAGALATAALAACGDGTSAGPEQPTTAAATSTAAPTAGTMTTAAATATAEPTTAPAATATATATSAAAAEPTATAKATATRTVVKPVPTPTRNIAKPYGAPPAAGLLV